MFEHQQPPSRCRARAGALVALLPVALTACSSEPVAERDRLVDAVAEAARATELGRLKDLAARQDALGDELGDELRDELSTVMVDSEPPPGVAEIRVLHGGLGTSRGAEFVLVTRPLVVVPDDGALFCAVVGLSSDGTAAGSRADGEVADDCREAVIPSQAELSAEGNPLDLWDQTDQPL